MANRATLGRVAPLDPASQAAAFQVSTQMLPHMAHLLQDLDALGCFPDLACDLLAQAGLGQGETLLDLGCGKGAACLQAAQTLSLVCTGIDAYPPFIEHSRSAAEKLDLSRFCTFVTGDVRSAVQSAQQFDAVLLLSVGNPFADPTSHKKQDPAVTLRQCVAAGGVMLVDSLLSRDAAPVAGQTLATGDTEELVATVPLERMRRQNREYLEALVSRADEVAAKEPSLARELREYIVTQQRECQQMEATMHRVLRLIRKVH